MVDKVVRNDDNSADIRAAILIGGGSGRMGFPKSLLKIGPEFLLERIARAASIATREIVLVGAGNVPGKLLKMPRLEDVPDVGGPLGGLLSVFRWRPRSRWLVFSCDLPLATSEAVEWLISRSAPDVLAVLPYLDSPDIPEPFFALYEPAAAEALERAAAGGGRSVRRVLARERIASPRVPDHLRDAWRNVNTPDDWKTALAQIRKEADP